MTEELRTRARRRLRAFIERHMHGDCYWLSLGEECACPLCDLDRLAPASGEGTEPKAHWRDVITWGKL